MKKLYIFFISVLLLSSGIALAQPIPTGRAITVDDVLLLGKNIAGFLMLAGGVLAGITIIVTGIMYLSSGSSPQRLATAKGMFKVGIIGALIIFSSGMLIATIRGFAEDPLGFFDTGTCQGGIRSGQSCSGNIDCPNDVPGTCGGAGQVLCSFAFCY